MAEFLSAEELQDGLDDILQAPKDDGVLEMVVCRPATGEREVLNEGRLEVDDGLLGDNWKARGSRRTKDGSAHPDMQLNLMNVRVTRLVAQHKDRWPLAGDQLYVDFDLGKENVPPGTRLKIGEAEVEVTAVPHLGCQKFVDRFGPEAMKFVNSKTGRRHNLRGVNARVVTPGLVQVGDRVLKK